MVTVQKVDYEALETLIQRYRLQQLMEVIAYICGKISEKARNQWKDENLAAAWERDACMIDRVRSFLAN